MCSHEFDFCSLRVETLKFDKNVMLWGMCKGPNCHPPGHHRHHYQSVVLFSVKRTRNKQQSKDLQFDKTNQSLTKAGKSQHSHATTDICHQKQNKQADPSEVFCFSFFFLALNNNIFFKSIFHLYLFYLAIRNSISQQSMQNILSV